MNKLLQLIGANGVAAIQARTGHTPSSDDKTTRALLVRNAATPTEAKLYIYDVITPYADEYWGGISAKMVLAAIAQIEDPANTTLHVHINSPGGDVFEGRAIRTALKSYAGPVQGHVDALAASAATTVADGCDSCDIAQGAMFMIHNSWTLAYGDKQDLTKTAELLNKIDEAIAADYQQRTGADFAQIIDWMNQETWFSAQDAVAHKFCSAVVASGGTPEGQGTTSNRASVWDLSAYTNAPKNMDAIQTSAPQSSVDEQAADWSGHVQRRLALVNLNLRSSG